MYGLLCVDTLLLDVVKFFTFKSTEKEQVKFLASYFTANEYHLFEKIRQERIGALGSDYFIRYLKQFSEAYTEMFSTFYTATER